MTSTKEQSKEELKLADTAFYKIQKIFFNHAQKAYLEVAEYIAKTFFDNDFELVKSWKPAGNKVRSFNQLIKLIQGQIEGYLEKLSFAPNPALRKKILSSTYNYMPAVKFPQAP